MINTIISYLVNKVAPLFIGFTLIGLIQFTLLNLIYVVINTIKTISANKANPNDKKAKRISSWISTFCYMWYTVILKMIANNNIVESFIGTGISNYFGNYLGISLSKKVIKRNWRHCLINISRTKYSEEEIITFTNELRENNLKHNVADKFQFIPGTLKKDKAKRYYEFTVFSKSEEQDKKIQSIIEVHNLKRHDWVEGGPIEEETK